MRWLSTPPADWLPLKLYFRLAGLLHFRLYGVRYGRRLRLKRVSVLNHGSIEIGDDVSILSYPDGTPYPSSLRAYTPRARITIGRDTRIAGAIIHCNLEVTIGPNARIGPGVIFCDNDSHPPKRTIEERSGRPTEAPIVLEPHVWLGMRVLVMKGVTIGENTIVAPNSVVTRSLPPNVLAGGNPAKPIRELD